MSLAHIIQPEWQCGVSDTQAAGIVNIVIVETDSSVRRKTIKA